MISVAELTLPLPETKDLWFAKTAKDWKARHLEKGPLVGKKPSIGDLLHGLNHLTANRSNLDVRFCITLYLYGYWSLIWEYRLSSTISRQRAYAGTSENHLDVLLTSRYTQLVMDLQEFYSVVSEWPETSSQEHMLVHVLLLNLHVSMEDLLVFSGKEGEERARQVYPFLAEWTDTPPARAALWSAGQIIRYAKLFPPGHLQDFFAGAVYHAALTLWTYAVITRARPGRQSMKYGYDAIYLDGPETVLSSRYLNMGEGRPVIQGVQKRDPPIEAPVGDPRLCMEIVSEVLLMNQAHEPKQHPSPLIGSLGSLMKRLGSAAFEVGLG